MTNIRDIILDVLLEITRDGAMSHKALNSALEKNQYLSRRDRAFITRVCEGVIERMIEIDYIIDKFAQVPVARMKSVIQDILRSAVYQICFMGGVPNSAAVNEAVKLTQNRGFYNLKGFVNGVLRSVADGYEDIDYPDREEDPVKYMSVTYSTPTWLIEEWIGDYGEYATERMLKSFLTERPTTVRFKTHLTDKAAILESLREQGVTVRQASYLPYAYNISNYNFIKALKAFQKGWIYPQDVSSMLVAEVADPPKDGFVVDVCASPGGKTLHIADKMQGQGAVEARDLSADKVALIEENVTRARLLNVKCRVRDALVLDPSVSSRADVVICDLPCSGLGVIGRKPDIKYRVSQDRIRELVELQRRILTNAAAYAKPGGVLIYSTCTVSMAENQENAAWFAQNFPYKPESLDPYLPAELRQLTTSEGYLQMLPGIHDSDGFFIARFRRNSAEQ